MSYGEQELERSTAPIDVQMQDLKVKKQTIEVLMMRKTQEIEELKEKDKAIEQIMSDISRAAA